MFLFYPFCIIKAISNRLNLFLSQKSNSVRYCIFLSKLCFSFKGFFTMSDLILFKKVLFFTIAILLPYPIRPYKKSVQSSVLSSSSLKSLKRFLEGREPHLLSVNMNNSKRAVLLTLIVSVIDVTLGLGLSIPHKNNHKR